MQVYGVEPNSDLDLGKLDVTRPATQRMVSAADRKLLDDTSAKQ